MPSGAEGGLGAALIGDKIMINHHHVAVTKLLGEGGFSYVYLVKEISDTSTGQSLNNTIHGEGPVQRSGSGSGASGRAGSLGNGNRRSIGSSEKEKREMVLKVTSILSRQQRDIAEKEAKLLSRLSHPSIIKMFDTCYRSVVHPGGNRRSSKTDDKQKDRPQHLILMEFCEGGHALDVCAKMAAAGTRFDLSSLIIAFGQICNAVSYLHAQRPPIVHRDLKPANFLVKNGAYKLCDFGSAVFGHVDVKTPKARAEAEEVIQKTTTQMFRAPEMVDLYMAKKLTQATDVWALGCCLYSLAFLQNCFEEGSNLAILSRKYKIPEDNPYGDGLVELLDRMLTVDSKSRADMTEVILCLSAVYSERPLPPRKERSKSKKDEKEKTSSSKKESSSKKKSEKAGTFRTDGQGIYEDLEIDQEVLKEAPVKKLNPNSAAARRRAAAGDMEFASFHSKFEEVAAQEQTAKINPDLAFSMDNPFAAFDNVKNDGNDTGRDDLFASFEESAADISDDVIEVFGKSQNWGGKDDKKSSGKFDAFASFSPDAGEAQMTRGNIDDEDSEINDDEDDDERGEVEEDGGEKNNHSASRRRGSSSRRSTRSGSSDPDSAGEVANINDDDVGRAKRPPIRRARSGSRRKSRTSKDEADETPEHAAAASGSSDDGEDGGEEKGSRVRRSSGSGRLRRTHSGSDQVRQAAHAVRRSISSREAGSSSRSSQRKESSSKPRSMSTGGSAS